MRILLDAIQAGNQSGTGSYTEQLLTFLSGQDAPGFEIHAVLPRSWAPPFPTDHLAGITRVSTTPRLAGSLYRNFGLAATIRRVQPDVVHFPSNIGRIVSTIGRNQAYKTVLTVHDLSFLRHPEWFKKERAVYYAFGARRSVARATRVIADSEATARDLRELLGVPSESIDVVYLGNDPLFLPQEPEVVESVRKQHGLPESFLLYVGTLEPRKNIPRLIAAFDAIAGKVDCDLVVAGREGWKTGAIHDALRRSPNRSRIHVPGFIPPADLPAVMSAALAFVWPSLWEGFGLPPLNAMACGVPVLTSNVSSLPEVCGDAAILVDPMDQSAIAAEMLRLASDARLRDELRSAGMNRAREFTWERTATETRESYRRAHAT